MTTANIRRKIKNWPRYEMVDPHTLVIDDVIQRDQQDRDGRRQIERIKREFDPMLFVPPHVVKRTHGDRKWTVVDGGHRAIAAQEMNLEKIPVMIVTGRSYEREGKLFEDLNTKKRAVKPTDTYRVIADTNPRSIEALSRSVLKSYNLHVGTGDGNRIMRCSNQIKAAYNRLTESTFDQLAHGLSLVPPKIEKIHGYIVVALTEAVMRVPDDEIVAMIEYFWDFYPRIKGIADEMTSGNTSTNPSALATALLEEWDTVEIVQ